MEETQCGVWDRWPETQVVRQLSALPASIPTQQGQREEQGQNG
jgi:hypothetical protein